MEIEPRLRHVLAGLLCASVLAFELYGIFISTHGVPVNSLAAGRYLAGEIQGDQVVAQTFRVKAAGLSSVTVYPATFGDGVEGTARFELFQLDPDQTERLVFGGSRSALDVIAQSAFRIDFPAIDDSDGGLFRLEVRVSDARSGHGLGLWANRDNTYRDGTLIVNGREQWGDLAFATTAPEATAFRHLQSLLRSKPAWLRSPLAFVLLFSLYNAALFVFVLTAIRHVPTRFSVMATSRETNMRRMVLAAVVVVAGMAAFAVWRLNVPPLERGAIDLIELFPEAEKRTTRPDLHTWFDVIDVTIKGETKPSIFAHAPSRIIWRLEIPPAAVLRVSAAIRPDVWQQDSDGAAFRVGISDGKEYKQYYRHYLMPLAFERDRAWHAVEIDLSRYAGQKVEVIFNTDPGELNAVRDACVWGLPRIVPNAVH